MLTPIESFKMLKGFPLARWKIVKSEPDLDFQFPFWLKADISGHKIEEKAVLKCRDKDEAQKNLAFLRKKFPASSILIQEQVEGIEMILGVKEDKVFSKLLMIGFGGTFTEVIKDTSFRALPVNKAEIESMLKELKLYPTLINRKKFALDKLISLAEKVSRLEIKEADFNPVILNEKEAVIVDARIEV